MPRLLTYPVVSRALGLLLCAAGLLKSHEMVGPYHSAEPRWTEAGVALFEVFLALWLLSGVKPRAAWWMAAVTFVTFLGVSLDKALAGEVSCGCFGELRVNPWYTLGIDVAAVLALAVSYPRGEAPPSRRQIAARLSLSVGLVSVAAGACLRGRYWRRGGRPVGRRVLTRTSGSASGST